MKTQATVSENHQEHEEKKLNTNSLGEMTLEIIDEEYTMNMLKDRTEDSRKAHSIIKRE